MAISPSFIITRFAQSIFTGPVRPTPGTAKAYIKKAQDTYASEIAGQYSDAYYKNRNTYQGWPGNNPPIDIEIKNLARPDLTGADDSMILVGLNPGTLTDSGSEPRFDSVDVLGRSSPFAVYRGGGARSVKATFKIHRDMFSFYLPFGPRAMNDINYWEEMKKMEEEGWGSEDTISYMEAQLASAKKNLNEEILKAYRNTLNWIRALQYPVYDNGGVIAPKVYMRIGKFLMIEGYPRVNISYDSIYSEGYPVVANVDLTVTETLQRAYDQKDIFAKDGRSGGMDYVEWPSK